MFYNPVFLCLMMVLLLLGFIAQAGVQSKFRQYAKVRTMRGLTGAQVARQILDVNGLYDVTIEEAGGFLTDHYDPSRRILRLSSEVARTPSVAAAGVAAHEAGHALQHANGYAPLKLRTFMVPAVQFGSWLGPIIIISGLSLDFISRNLGVMGYYLAWLGVGVYALVALFSVITVPVELDASARAKRLLYQYDILDKQELAGVNSVLNAAAWTYVIAALSALLELSRWIFILLGRRR
jgi:Zn-dependent membrane protease YugP